ncbi:DUF3574 domain-containing protein [Azospirillum doebereinerae]|uniref:DUF3574 domain-containing protein n=1 Tax=Azospirillum doebereinerae TaxID=92933 RepID=A0A3S0WPN6_9PROT|nr:DUF3574 domain-containing protein [Azospirillum doebereinerae]RUQ75678.1 DUF3574 domain-containing protein [Azospirillum doebereinerae]
MIRAALLSLALCVPATVSAQLAPASPPVATMECGALAGSPMIEATLFFGRNIGDAVGVSERDWSQFLDQEVTPRFPDGLTVHDGSGHWRDSRTGRLVREPSKILILLTPRDGDSLLSIQEIVDRYKERFHQQSVGTVMRPACVGF